MRTRRRPRRLASRIPRCRSRLTVSGSSLRRACAGRFWKDNTFGAGQTYTPYVGVITIFVTRLLRGERIAIFGDGEQQRDFVHVDDIAAGTMATVGRTPGTYNLGTGKGTSLNQLATLLLDKLAPGIVPVYQPPQPGELRFSVADIAAARRSLGYAPQRTLAADIDSVIADIRQRVDPAAP
jgi:UDP-glucose 4-epimerase